MIFSTKKNIYNENDPKTLSKNESTTNFLSDPQNGFLNRNSITGRYCFLTGKSNTFWIRFLLHIRTACWSHLVYCKQKTDHKSKPHQKPWWVVSIYDLRSLSRWIYSQEWISHLISMKSCTPQRAGFCMFIKAAQYGTWRSMS